MCVIRPAADKLITVDRFELNRLKFLLDASQLGEDEKQKILNEARYNDYYIRAHLDHAERRAARDYIIALGEARLDAVEAKKKAKESEEESEREESEGEEDGDKGFKFSILLFLTHRRCYQCNQRAAQTSQNSTVPSLLQIDDAFRGFFVSSKAQRYGKREPISNSTEKIHVRV